MLWNGAILFSDILVVPDALGQAVEFHDPGGPALVPLRSESDLRRLDLAAVAERLDPVYSALRELRGRLPERTALIGFAGAPWTVATYMIEGGTSRDFTTAKAWAQSAPASFQSLIDLLIEAITQHLSAQVEAGAEVLQLFDSWAGVLSETSFDRYAIAPTQEIVRRLKAVQPEVPIIGFPRGAGVLYGKYARDSGVDAVGIDSAVPVIWAAQELQPVVAIQGNLDPTSLLTGGEAMRSEVERILVALSSGPFVFNLGHGVLPATPPEHVTELCGLVRAWR